MRCAECGASNSETADWCGRCYGSLRPVTAQEPQVAPAAPTAEAAVPSGFRRRDSALEWQCPGCGRWTSVESLGCAACGVTIATPDDDVDAGAVAQRLAEPWTAVFALSAVVPGAGHIGLGRYGTGLARALLFAVWAVGGVALWRVGGVVAGGPFALGAGLLWAGTLADVAALRAGSRELLGGRSLLWLTVGVTVLGLVGVLTASAGGG